MQHGAIPMKRNLRAEVEAADPLRRMLRLARKAEAQAHDLALQKLGRQEIDGPVNDVGTGNTILKLRDHPLAKMIIRHELVPEAVTAADEIHTAFHAIAGCVMIQPGSLERIDGRGKGDLPWLAHVSRPVSNYQAFARHWTKRANLGDPMLEVLIAVVIDERGIRDVAHQVRYHHSRVKRAVIAGLQDYAARSGFVTGGLATRWMDVAAGIFPVFGVDAGARLAAGKLQHAVDAARGL